MYKAILNIKLCYIDITVILYSPRMRERAPRHERACANAVASELLRSSFEVMRMHASARMRFKRGISLEIGNESYGAQNVLLGTKECKIRLDL
jgi:hypothetical protein